MSDPSRAREEPLVNPARSDALSTDHEDANAMMATGAGIAAVGLASALIGGAACPVCIVAAPALLGIGAFRKWRARAKVTPTR